MEPIFFDLEVDNESKRVCLVDFPKHQVIDDLADLLVTQHTGNIEQTDLVVLRPDVEVPIVDLRKYKELLPPLQRRAPHAGIHLLYSTDFEHRLSHDLVSDSETHSHQTNRSMIQGIRERELEHYAKKSDAILPARDGLVYRAPSNHYLRQFLRVGNIQKTRQPLDAVFFWMLPFLKDCGAIVVDTWSIGSIALNAALLLERYESKKCCRVEMLPAYFDGSHESLNVADTVVRNLQHGKDSILLLFSSVRSGVSFKRLRKTFTTIVPAGRLSYLAIYRFGDDISMPALCTRLEGFETAERKGTVVTIDPSSLFPLTARDDDLPIVKAQSDPNRDFYDSYGGLAALRIHRDVHDSFGQKIRHHAFDIDVESMFVTDKFCRQFDKKLKSLPPPSIIVVPSHNAGKLLGAKAQEILESRYGQSPELIVHPNLHPQDKSPLDPQGMTLEDVFQQTNEETNILILDDVSTTGRRLSSYQANLRLWKFRGHISYLVGVARPDDEGVWSNRIQNLRLGIKGRPNKVECIEQIVLPNWEESECPWCLEYQQLSDMIRSQIFSKNSHELMLKRQRHLQIASDAEGLINQVFWIPPRQQRPTLGPGSIFIGHEGVSEADVVASVASAIQRMRVDPMEENRLSSEYPLPRILSPKNYLGESPRFNEAILKMAVLRSTRPSELRRWDDKDECDRTAGFRQAFSDSCMSLELTVALQQEKFSLMKKDPMDLQPIQPPEVREILINAVDSMIGVDREGSPFRVRRLAAAADGTTRV